MSGLVKFGNALSHAVRSVARNIPIIPREAIAFKLTKGATMTGHIPARIPGEAKLKTLIALKELSRHAISGKNVKQCSDVGKIVIHYFCLLFFSTGISIT